MKHRSVGTGGFGGGFGFGSDSPSNGTGGFGGGFGFGSDSASNESRIIYRIFQHMILRYPEKTESDEYVNKRIYLK